MTDAPNVDEFEVSLFGPGIGECAVLHIGDNEWIVVDSCVDRTSRSPVALSYLQQLGVDVSKNVKLIVLTHWHDDHVRGASTLAAEAIAAPVVFSSAMRANEFKTLLAATDAPFMAESGLDEMRKLVDLLVAREKSGGGSMRRWAIANRQLLRTETCRLTALSPSDQSFNRAAEEFASLLPESGNPKRRFVSQSPNSLSVVLHAQLGLHVILLGADLERTKDESLGWRAIVNSSERPEAKAGIFKVPHHGANNADYPDVWNRLLEPDPFALLSPYSAGRRPRPSESDVRRIKSRTTRAYLTAPPGKRIKIRDNALRKMMTKAAKDLRVLEGDMGHVRVRGPIHESALPEVQCFGPARPL